MSDKPTPLVPAEVDLRDFPFIPLHIQRLRRSKAWLKCKRTPALAFYMVNLWTAAWHDVPAGSLEDDDDVLADLAMCDPAKWVKVRSDVLHGWVKADDGRLYHPTVCEQALLSWDSKLDQRWRTECARIKKHADRHKIPLPRPTFEEWVAAGCPQGQRLPVPRDTDGTCIGQSGENGSKGQGEGQGQGQGELKDPVPDGTDGVPPSPPAPQPVAETAEKRKARLWRAGKSLLHELGALPTEQCGTFIGALARQYTEAIALDAIEAAVLQRPADPQAWLVATCQARKPLGRAAMTADQQQATSDAMAERLMAAMNATGGAVRPAATLVERIDS
jgi:Protein of unknown function (DUF1376)